MASRIRLEQPLKVRQDLQKGELITLEGTLRYRKYEQEVHGLTVRRRVAEVHPAGMKRISKIEAADDPNSIFIIRNG